MTPQKFQHNGHLSSTHGFTLIEILVAILILGMVMSAVYAAYSGTMKLVQEMTYENNVYNEARMAMDRIVRDLSSVQPLGGAFEMRSDKEAWKNREFGSLYFWAASHLAFNEKEIDGSPTLIGYVVREDAGGGTFSLYRSDLPVNKAIKEKNKTGGYVICPDIDFLIFKFYDSNGKEYDSWDSSSSETEQKGKVPAIIKIELGLSNVNDKEKPFKFMTKVFLPAKL
jgi:general secretion pathway protein J